MQKALTTMNVQLANAISDLSGVTGQAIIRAILGGERNPYKLAGLRDRRIAASEEEIARSLEGNWQEDLLFALRQAVAAYDFQQQQLSDCDRQLQIYLAKLPDRPIATDETANRTTPPQEETEKPETKPECAEVVRSGGSADKGLRHGRNQNRRHRRDDDADDRCRVRDGSEKQLAGRIQIRVVAEPDSQAGHQRGQGDPAQT